MKGNIFTCHGEGSSDKQQCLKTVGVLEEHVNKTFSYPQGVASVCKSFEIVQLVQPANLTKADYDTDMGKKMIWETSMKKHMKWKDLMESNTIAIHAIVWGQCSPMMQSKLESLEDFKAKNKSCDCVWLLKEIQGITHRFEGTRNVFISLDDAWTDFHAFKQGQHQQLYDCLKDFQAPVQALEHCGAEFGADGPNVASALADVRKEHPGETNAQNKKRAVLSAKRKSIAIAFLKNADPTRHAGLMQDLENQCSRGLDHCPADVVGFYDLLTNCKAPPRQHQPRQPAQPDDSDTVSALTFSQGTGPAPGTDGVPHSTVECFHCHDKGNHANLCPTRDEMTMLQVEPINAVPEEDTFQEEEATQDEESHVSEFTFMNVALDQDTSLLKHFSFHQSADIIPDTWILLDSQSTVSVFKNRLLLTNMRAASKVLCVHANGGVQLNRDIGTVKNFGDVWFNPDSLANTLSMSAVSRACRITMDSSIENALHVHRKNGTIMTFKEHKSGSHCYDAASKSNDHGSKQVEACLFLNTVADNKAQHTRREIEGAEKARKLQRFIGDPSEQRCRVNAADSDCADASVRST
jgi:hypothetical protein